MSLRKDPLYLLLTDVEQMASRARREMRRGNYNIVSVANVTEAIYHRASETRYAARRRRDHAIQRERIA